MIDIRRWCITSRYYPRTRTLSTARKNRNFYNFDLRDHRRKQQYLGALCFVQIKRKNLVMIFKIIII